MLPISFGVKNCEYKEVCQSNFEEGTTAVHLVQITLS